MTQIKAAQPVFETTASALREKSELRRHFRRFDMFFYLICTVVTIDTIGAVASNGAQGFTWLIFLGVFFFLPYALSVAELGSAVRLRYKRPDVDRPYRVPGGMAGAWICSVVPTFWALLATVALIWPGFGVNWFGAGGNPNDNLAALSFSHQRLQYELTQIVPLAAMIVVGVVFYFLGGRTRQETVAEPVMAYAPVTAPTPAASDRAEQAS